MRKLLVVLVCGVALRTPPERRLASCAQGSDDVPAGKVREIGVEDFQTFRLKQRIRKWVKDGSDTKAHEALKDARRSFYHDLRLSEGEAGNWMIVFALELARSAETVGERYRIHQLVYSRKPVRVLEPQLLERVIDALASEHPFVSYEALGVLESYAVAEVGGSTRLQHESQEKIKGFLASKYPWVRKHALSFLLDYYPKQSLMATLENLRRSDPSFSVRAVIVGDLYVAKHPKRNTYVLDLFETWNKTRPPFVAKPGKDPKDEAEQILIRILSTSQRAFAESPYDWDTLIGCPKFDLRLYAIRAIAMMKCLKAGPVLYGLLDDESPRIRLEALRALCHIGHELAAKALSEAEDDTDKEMRTFVRQEKQRRERTGR